MTAALDFQLCLGIPKATLACPVTLDFGLAKPITSANHNLFLAALTTFQTCFSEELSRVESVSCQ